MFYSDLRGQEIIDDSTGLDLARDAEGAELGRGYIERDYDDKPVGSIEFATPFYLESIPRSQWGDLCERQEKHGSLVSTTRARHQLKSSNQGRLGYCHSADTEVLTEKGWVRWDEYDGKTPLATVNPNSKQIEYQTPTHFHTPEYDGDLIVSTNRRVNFAVTPNHRMWVRKWDEKERTLSKEYEFVLAKDLGWYVGLMAAPDVTLKDNERSRFDTPVPDCSPTDFLALLALVISDGYVGCNPKDLGHVSFCCFDDVRIEDVRALAERIGFTEQASRPGVFHHYSHHTLADWLRENVYFNGDRSPEKVLPSFVLHLSPGEKEHFLYFFGDRSKSTAPLEGPYYSTSYTLISGLQAVMLSLGVRGTIVTQEPKTSTLANGKKIVGKHVSYTLVLSQTDKLCLERKNHIARRKYKGKVYCATVPNGTLVTRYDGDVLISGNCWIHGCVNAMRLLRAQYGMPYADLEPTMAGALIKNYRNQGGNTPEAIRHLARLGVCTTRFWKPNSLDRSQDTPEMRANAAKYKLTEWWELKSNNFGQLATCLLLGYPVVIGLSWWGHMIVAMDLVKLGRDEFGVRIWNSWGDGWGDKGEKILTEKKATAFDQMCPRVVTHTYDSDDVGYVNPYIVAA